MTAFGFGERDVKRIGEFVLRSERQVRAGSRRRRQPPVLEGARLPVLGPCAEYVPDEELPDTDFDIDYGDGCDGPSRYGLIYITTISAEPSTVVIELETTTPLVLTSDMFEHGCFIGAKTLEIEMEVTSLDIGGTEVRFLESGSPIAIYQNTMYRWLPMLGGYLQCIDAPCDCATFPFDICLSVPTR